MVRAIHIYVEQDSVDAFCDLKSSALLIGWSQSEGLCGRLGVDVDIAICVCGGCRNRCSIAVEHAENVTHALQHAIDNGMTATSEVHNATIVVHDSLSVDRNAVAVHDNVAARMIAGQILHANMLHDRTGARMLIRQTAMARGDTAVVIRDSAMIDIDIAAVVQDIAVIDIDVAIVARDGRVVGVDISVVARDWTIIDSDVAVI